MTWKFKSYASTCGLFNICDIGDAYNYFLHHLPSKRTAGIAKSKSAIRNGHFYFTRESIDKDLVKRFLLEESGKLFYIANIMEYCFRITLNLIENEDTETTSFPTELKNGTIYSRDGLIKIRRYLDTDSIILSRSGAHDTLGIPKSHFFIENGTLYILLDPSKEIKLNEASDLLLLLYHYPPCFKLGNKVYATIHLEFPKLAEIDSYSEFKNTLSNADYGRNKNTDDTSSYSTGLKDLVTQPMFRHIAKLPVIPFLSETFDPLPISKDQWLSRAGITSTPPKISKPELLTIPLDSSTSQTVTEIAKLISTTRKRLEDNARIALANSYIKTQEYATGRRCSSTYSTERARVISDMHKSITETCRTGMIAREGSFGLGLSISELLKSRSINGVSQNISDLYPNSTVQTNCVVNHSTKKETNMTSINTQALWDLADAEAQRINAEFNIRSLPINSDLGERLKKLQAEEADKTMDRAAAEIYKLLTRSLEARKHVVGVIRSARRQEQEAKATLAEIERAELYGSETNDYRPLMVLLGLASSSAKVPADWKPKSEAKPRARASKAASADA